MDDEEEAESSRPSKSKKQKTEHEGKSAATSAANGTKGSFKNPTVDTSFLPDRHREEEERRIREELRQEWLKKQVEMKKEDIEITYSYWTEAAIGTASR